MIVGFVVLYNALDITNYKKKNALEEENLEILNDCEKKISNTFKEIKTYRLRWLFDNFIYYYKSI